jgi:hypothetical protein
VKNRLAIVHCIHHKPWLIMSTLITTLAQNFKEFDIYFLHQLGHGERFHGKTHEEDFNEYYRLVEECGVNAQLDSYDPRTKEVCQINRSNVYQIEFENDHGLDSGAWYKFIKKKLWKDYEYILFMGEGALLTGETVLEDTLRFAQKNDVHFITGSQEKRRLPKELFLNGFAGSKQSSPMAMFHDKMIGKTFDHFCRDPEFKKTMEQWSSYFSVEQQHHVPDVWGKKGQWLKVVNRFYPNLAKESPSFKKHIKQFLFRINKLHYLKLQQESLKVLNHSYVELKQQEPEIVVNGNWNKLSTVVDFQEQGNVKFHSSMDPAWFGATCNHFVSRDFLERFSEKLESFKIYEVLELPFSATALEIIWGHIPVWLGFEKFFFDGIHRVRKNFITYRREDDPDGMVRYLNRYYRGKIVVEYQGDFIKIKQCSDAFEGISQELNNFYN